MSIAAQLGAPVAARSAWRTALPALVLLIVLVLWAYGHTALAMVTIWSRSATFTHAFVVPPIVAWLVWRQRGALAALTPRASLWALAGFLLAGLGWLLGDLTSTNALAQASFVAMLALTVPVLLGWQVARTLAFPLGFLFFTVPFGEFLLPQLMESTADFTVLALRASGIPVYREGLQFVIPSGNWSVVEACSGIRYLIASLMVGVLYAYLNYRSAGRRLVFAGLSIVVPVVANWVRAYLIVLIGHLSGNKLAVGVDHLFYGWVFFGIVIGLMYMIGVRWAEPDAPAGAPLDTATRVSEASAVRAWAVVAGAAVLVVAPFGALDVIARADHPGVPRLGAPAALAGEWVPSASAFVDWKPAFQGAAAEAEQAYAQGSHQVGLYLGYYRRQDFDHKLVSSENVLVTLHDHRWAQTSSRVERLEIDGETIAVRRADLRASPHPGQEAGPGLVAWQLYWVNGRLTESDEVARAYGGWYRLLGRGDDAAVIVVYAGVDTAGGADALLASFMRANLHAIEAQLARTRDGG